MTDPNAKDSKSSDAEAVELLHNLQRIIRVFLVSERRFPVAGRNARYSPHDFHTLKYLMEHKSARAGELGKHLEVAPTTMTGVLDRMEANGLIHRVPDAHDARATRLELTEMGQAMQAAIANQNILNAAAMLNALDPAERAKYVEMTIRIADKIEKLV